MKSLRITESFLSWLVNKKELKAQLMRVETMKMVEESCEYVMIVCHDVKLCDVIISARFLELYFEVSASLS